MRLAYLSLLSRSLRLGVTVHDLSVRVMIVHMHGTWHIYEFPFFGLCQTESNQERARTAFA